MTKEIHTSTQTPLRRGFLLHTHNEYIGLPAYVAGDQLIPVVFPLAPTTLPHSTLRTRGGEGKYFLRLFSCAARRSALRLPPVTYTGGKPPVSYTGNISMQTPCKSIACAAHACPKAAFFNTRINTLRKIRTWARIHKLHPHQSRKHRPLKQRKKSCHTRNTGQTLTGCAPWQCCPGLFFMPSRAGFEGGLLGWIFSSSSPAF